MKTRSLFFAMMLVLLLTVALTGSVAAGKSLPTVTVGTWSDDTISILGSHIFTASNVTVTRAPRGTSLVLVAYKETGWGTGNWFEISDRVAISRKVSSYNLTSRAVSFPGGTYPVRIRLYLLDAKGWPLQVQIPAVAPYTFSADQWWAP